MARGGADLLQPLLETEHGSFAGVLQHSHDHHIKQSACPFNQIQVAQGERIEAAG
jgi:hypothetical protein